MLSLRASALTGNYRLELNDLWPGIVANKRAGHDSGENVAQGNRGILHAQFFSKLASE